MFKQPESMQALRIDRFGGPEVMERKSWEAVRHAGSLVSTVSEPSQDQAKSLGIRALRYTAESNASDLKAISALIDAGGIRPKVSRISSIRDARPALEEVEEGHTVGKSVLVMALIQR